jgi:hypothetical protein
VPAENLDQRLFPSRRWFIIYLFLSFLPRIVAANWHRDYLAKQAHRVLIPLRFDKAIAAHWLSVTESLRLQQATGNGFF